MPTQLMHLLLGRFYLLQQSLFARQRLLFARHRIRDPLLRHPRFRLRCRDTLSQQFRAAARVRSQAAFRLRDQA
jgi:hypothetical protein